MRTSLSLLLALSQAFSGALAAKHAGQPAHKVAPRLDALSPAGDTVKRQSSDSCSIGKACGRGCIMSSEECCNDDGDYCEAGAECFERSGIAKCCPSGETCTGNDDDDETTTSSTRLSGGSGSGSGDYQYYTTTFTYTILSTVSTTTMSYYASNSAEASSFFADVSSSLNDVPTPSSDSDLDDLFPSATASATSDLDIGGGSNIGGGLDIPDGPNSGGPGSYDGPGGDIPGAGGPGGLGYPYPQGSISTAASLWQNMFGVWQTGVIASMITVPGFLAIFL